MNTLAYGIFRLLRYPKTLLAVFALLIPLVAFGSVTAWLGTNNRVEEWLPQEFDEWKQLERFIDLFGSDELLMISWDDCSPDDPLVAEFQKRLMTPVQVDGRSVNYYWRVVSGAEILAGYMAPPLELSRDEAIARMSRWLISDDGRLTCLVASISAEGGRDRRAAIQRVWDVAAEMPDLPAEKVRLAGTTMESVAIDEASTRRLVEINVLSFLICFLLIFACFRSVRTGLLVFGIAFFNEFMCLALVYYLRSTFDAILMLAANLTFVTTISLSIHLINYYRDAMGARRPDTAVLHALHCATMPSLLSSSTTVIGLLSLTVSQLVPIVKFGFFSGLAIVVATLIVLVYVPLHFKIWPMHRWHDVPEEKQARLATRLTGGILFPMARYGYLPILLASVLLSAVGIAGVVKVRASVGLRQLLTSHTRAIQDYTWMEDRIGPLIPVEILIEGKAADAREMMKRLRVIAHLHSELLQSFPDDAVISIHNFLPPLPPEAGGARQMAANVAFRRTLEEQKPLLEQLGYLAEIDGRQYWRLTVRTYAMKETNLTAFLGRVQDVVGRVLKEDRSHLEQPLTHSVCGGVPIFEKAQNQLIDDMKKSFLTAFLTIGLVLVILFRSFSAGALCLVPNIMPSIIVFGVFGWYGVPVELGTVLTTCAALGISVDDTIHFITWFREGIIAGKSRVEAVRFAYRHCGEAMIQTSLVCGLGLLVFSVSSFIPMIRFGWCMFTLLMIALLCDLIVTPAILISPLGEQFTRFGRRRTGSGERRREA